MNLPVIDAAPKEFAAYAYSYPHKSSYRPLDPPVPLAQVWQDEPRDRLGLYVHVPFCEARCGFCNLFTQSQPQTDIVQAYVATLRRQMHVVRDQLGPATFRQFAIGGGTPTWLDESQLIRLLSDLEKIYDFRIQDVPTSVETSPATATPDRLRALSAFGVERISLGIQSFDAWELGRIGRPQQRADVDRALENIRDAGFPILNVDLIYGDAQQSIPGWLRSLEAALAYVPEEIYLYPLYVRPDTGLAGIGRSAEHRTELYRAGRDLLRVRGYRQSSLRCFRLPRHDPPNEFSCQRDGSVGLGCGARSYTRSLHYSTRFAVTQAGVRAILANWIQQSDAELSLATHGIPLDHEERRRRFLILSLLQSDGLSTSDYSDRFQSSPEADFPEIWELRRRDWLADDKNRLVLTESGMENSDVVGPLLYSVSVRSKLREFARI